MTPTLTLPRAVVEQAAEALELGHESARVEADRYHAAMAGYKPQRHAQMDAEVQQIAAAITAMRAALAQQAEPVEPVACSNTFGCRCPKHFAAQQAEPVEPVAWMYTGIKQDGTEHGPHLVWKPEYMDPMSASKGAKATPLYTARPRYTLSELLKRMQPGDMPRADEWDAAPPAGQEEGPKP